MQKIEIKPLEGIVIENIGKVPLGLHKNDLYKLLGPPSTDDGEGRIFYDALEVRFDINQSQTIEFIEFIYGPYPENTELTIYGVNPFTIGADSLLDLLSSYNHEDPDTSGSPYTYIFLNTSIGVWRDIAPKDIEPMPDDIEDVNTDEELKKARNFWTIGIGVADYYRM